MKKRSSPKSPRNDSPSQGQARTSHSQVERAGDLASNKAVSTDPNVVSTTPMMHPLERVAQWITRGSKMLSATDPMVLRTMAAIIFGIAVQAQAQAKAEAKAEEVARAEGARSHEPHSVRLA